MAMIKLKGRILDEDEIRELATQVTWEYTDYLEDDTPLYSNEDQTSMSNEAYASIVNELAKNVTEGQLIRHLVDTTNLNESIDINAEGPTFKDVIKACIYALSDVNIEGFPNWKRVFRYEHLEYRDEMEFDLVKYCEKSGYSGIMDSFKAIKYWSKCCPKEFLDYYGYKKGDTIAAAYLYLVSENVFTDGIFKNGVKAAKETSDFNFKVYITVNDYAYKNNVDIAELIKNVPVTEIWGKYPSEIAIVRAYHYLVTNGLIASIEG